MTIYIEKVRTGNTHRVHTQRDIPCHDCWDPASDHLPILTNHVRIGVTNQPTVVAQIISKRSDGTAFD